jgi:hypothetical protein
MADTIETTISDSGLWLITGRTWRKVFEDMCLVLAWGNPSQPDTVDHAVAVAGREEDGSIDVCDGFNGTFGDVMNEAVNRKDIYRISRGYCEPEPPGHVIQARRTDGLCCYQPAPDQFSTLRPRYFHAPDYWPHFVSYDHVMSLGSLPEDRCRDIESSITRMEELAVQGRVKFARRKWPALFEALGRARARMASKAIVRAAAHAVDRLYRERQGTPPQKTVSVYGNLPRRR